MGVVDPELYNYKLVLKYVLVSCFPHNEQATLIINIDKKYK